MKKKSNKRKLDDVKIKKSLFKDNIVVNTFFTTLFIFTIELIFKAISDYSIFDYSTLRILLSSFMLSLLVVFVSFLFKHKWIRNSIILVFIFAYSIYSWLQLGFMNFLGVYISFNTTSQVAAVINYLYDFIISFKLIYYVIYLPFIWAVVYFVIRKKRVYYKVKFSLKTLIIIPIILVSGVLYYLTLTLNFMQNDLQTKSNLQLFNNPTVPTVAVNQFGTVVFGLTDLKTFLFPIEDEYTIEYESNEENTLVTRVVLPVLDELAEKDSNSTYDNLNNYFASQTITDYNDYTGMFEGMNVIVILIESGSYALVNEEYFPNFYKLYSEGWTWENYYSPRNSCATGNNEFSAMTGLYSIYNTCTSNVYKNNTYFESIFGLFNNKGYITSAMHNFVEWYYYRSVSVTNMGTTFYGAKELGISTSGTYGEWPSDIDLVENALDIILEYDEDTPWMTWLTTVTSHQPYTTSSTYGDLYKEYFESEGYSTAVARYLSKLKVFDEALGILLDTLDSEGILDNTVIVMMPDHYPYGLKESYIKEMYDTDWDDYEKERVPFVIYNTSMESTVFSDYASYVDIVPTLANLLNLEYDPRLYMGTDLLSESHQSLVIFSDGSWKNEIAYYDASTSKITYYTDVTYTTEEIQEINTKVDLKLSMSSAAIKSDYFTYLKEQIEEYLNNAVVVDTDVVLSSNDDEE